MRRWMPIALVLVGATVLIGALLSSARKERTLARYTTPIEGRMADQRHNATLCITHLNGLVVEPGEEFSFNRAVGTWSRDKGYRRAPVSFGGLLVDSWGGGVCQTSSTLYNAALLAGMDVTERHKHHYAPTYIAPGRDAAVAFPNIDLRFRNPFDYPVTIVGRMTQGAVVVEIVGTGEQRRDVSIVQRVADVSPPQELLIGSGRFGRVRNPGHAGYSVDTYRIVDGVRELLSSDEYPVMNRIVEYK